MAMCYTRAWRQLISALLDSEGREVSTPLDEWKGTKTMTTRQRPLSREDVDVMCQSSVTELWGWHQGFGMDIWRLCATFSSLGKGILSSYLQQRHIKGMISQGPRTRDGTSGSRSSCLFRLGHLIPETLPTSPFRCRPIRLAHSRRQGFLHLCDLQARTGRPR